MPVLIDWWGKVEVNNSFKFTNLGNYIRDWKERLRPRGTVATGASLPNSDLYALAVTALVLLTEPQELYDSYKGILLQREISVSSQLETVLQKMLVSKSGDRYQSAEEVLKPAVLRHFTAARRQHLPDAYHQLCRTKPEPNAATAPQNGGTQVIATPTPHLGCLPWAVRVAGAGLIVLIGTNAWGGFTQ